MAREIEDFAHYVKLDVKKIDAVHSLDQLVAQNQLKKERAAYVRQKFEDLRATLGRKLMDERRTINETEELAEQLKKDKEELKKLLKEADEDEQALQLVKEDAEQADNEATLAREREQNLLLEATELLRIRDEYQKKLEDIEYEHFEALAPLISRMKLEVKNAGEQIVEDLAKIGTTTQEIEDGKAKRHELVEQNKVLKNERNEVWNNLANLDGVPEKYKKQCDIMINALQTLKNQEQKWVTKVKEVEAAVQSLYATSREKVEEHAKFVANFEKFKLLSEEKFRAPTFESSHALCKCLKKCKQGTLTWNPIMIDYIHKKERTCADIQKEIETTSQEVEQLLGDRVQLDMQLMGKVSDLKHETDTYQNRLKERDRASLRLREREVLVTKLQGQMPIFVQEKEKTHREFVLADALRKKGQARVEELRKDIDIAMNSFVVAENLGKEVAYIVKESHEKMQNLEAEVMTCNEVERKQVQYITELTNVRERLARSAAHKSALWTETRDKIGLQNNFITNFGKRVVELGRQFQELITLYNLVRSQRNKYASLITASAVTITEMKDKVVTLSTEVEQLQSEVLFKEKVLSKMHVDYEASVKGRSAIRDDITKCSQVWKEKKLVAEEQELEVINLEDIINKAEKDMVTARKRYGLAVKDRNTIGILLIDRNDELCILYEKCNVQVELLRHSEVELSKRVDEIDYLRRECNLTHKSILTQHRTTPNPESVYRELTSLKEQMERASTDVTQLSELIEKPSNLDRWRLLPGRDNTYHELTGKALAIEEFLSAKEDQAYEKDLVLVEVSALADDLMRKCALSRPEAVRIGKKINGYIRQMSIVTRRMMATVSELSLVQATVISMKQEKEAAQIILDEACQRLEIGKPPTEEIEKHWEAYLRECALLHKMEATREALRLEDEKERDARVQKKPPTSTHAEQRPNAYVAEKLGLPKPFGNHAPFRPSERGSTMRHVRKPEPKPIEI